jgi:crotonobetainyl-CoA:carnitine CoA-transferase CaiB-like acyl-CoA transferase
MRQVEAREMLIHMEHPEIGDLKLVGSPLKFSDTPVEYRLPPPGLGDNTEEILKEWTR